MTSTERESVKVLREAIELQLKKSKDYQNENSNVKQAMHYRRGVDSIHDVMDGQDPSRDMFNRPIEGKQIDPFTLAEYTSALLNPNATSEDFL